MHIAHAVKLKNPDCMQIYVKDRKSIHVRHNLLLGFSINDKFLIICTKYSITKGTITNEKNPYSAMVLVMPVPPNKFSTSDIDGDISSIPKPTGKIKKVSKKCCIDKAHGYNLIKSCDPSREKLVAPLNANSSKKEK